MNKLIASFKTVLEDELPGVAAQMEMSHVLRRSLKPAPDHAQKAGVMILLFPKSGEWHVALTQRASKYAHDKHKGQMSFPGGSMEDSDADLISTAKRETEEEIGIPREKIHALGLLTSLYIPVSNFLVQPVLGYVEEEPVFVLEENEVAELVSESVKVISSEAVRKLKNLKISKQMTLNQVPYFDIKGKVVWGATAMMLNEFVTLYRGQLKEGSGK